MPSDPNIQAIKQMPGWGKYLYSAFQSIQRQLTNAGTQTNASLGATQAPPPPQINALNVIASGGVAHVQIIDNNESLFRGIQYHVQYATDPGFSNPVNCHLGPSRDIRIPVGTQPLYYRAFSDYPTSPHSAPVYHGGVSPSAVAATGADAPAIPAGQGSGTGTPGQISGFGPIPWRGVNPPKRA